MKRQRIEVLHASDKNASGRNADLIGQSSSVLMSVSILIYCSSIRLRAVNEHYKQNTQLKSLPPIPSR